MATVKLPNGDTLTVPDTFDAAAVEAAAKRVMASPGYVAPPAPPPQPWVSHPRAVLPPADDSRLTRPVKEFGKGLAAGVASIADTPVNVARLATRVYDHATGQPVTDPFPRYGAGVQGLVENMLPAPVAGYEGVRTAGELTGAFMAPGGAGVVSRVASAGSKAPGIVSRVAGAGGQAVKELGKGMAGGAATYAGSNAGHMVGQAIGGDVGGDLGEFIGGGAISGAPAIVGAFGRNYARRNLLDDASAERLRYADAAGVTPSMGLVGNKQAAVLEDASSNLPFFGGRAVDMRRQQYTDMDRAALDIAEAVRGGLNPEQQTQGGLGAQAQAFATKIDDAAQKGISARQNAIENAVGSNTPISVVDTLNEAQRIATDPNLLPSERAPVTAQRNDLAGATRGGQAVYRTLKKWRNQLSDVYDRERPMSQENIAALRTAATGDMRTAVENAGLPAPVFDRLQSETTNLYNTRSGVEDYVIPQNKPGQPASQPRLNEKQSYDRLFGPSGEKSSSNVGALDPTNRGLPFERQLMSDFNTLMGNVLEFKTRGRASGAEPAPEAFSPRQVAVWWESLDPQMRSYYVKGDHALLRRMDALATVARMDMRRPTRTVPGAGGNTMGATWSQYGMPIASIMGTNSIPQAAKLIGTNLGLDAITGAFTDPATVRQIVTGRDTAGSMAREFATDVGQNMPAIVEPEVQRNKKRLTGNVSFMPGAR